MVIKIIHNILNKKNRYKNQENFAKNCKTKVYVIYKSSPISVILDYEHKFLPSANTPFINHGCPEMENQAFQWNNSNYKTTLE